MIGQAEAVLADDARRPPLGHVAGALAVLGRAGVLLVRHWPALVVIWLLGWLGREVALDAAVRASEHHSVSGVAVLALAILSELVALIWMLRVLRTSSPLPRPPAGGVEQERRRWRRLMRAAVPSLDSIASVLIPFLAIYVARDSFRVLFSDFAERVRIDQLNDDLVEGLTTGSVTASERIPWGGAVVWSVAAVAFVLRWLLRRRPRPTVSGWSLLRSTVAAYVEVLWLVLLVAAVNAWRKRVVSWVDRRRVVRAAGDVAGSFVDSLGVLTRPVRAARDLVTDSLGALDKVLLLPVAMLTVAAVVYGASVARPAPRDVSAEALQRVGGRWARVPARARRLAEAQMVAVGRRFQPLLDGLRLLAHAGLGPMLVFCFALGVAQMIDGWLWYVWRWTIGPRDIETWYAAGPVLEVIGALAVGLVSAALIGAAVERVAADERAREADADAQPVIDDAVVSPT